MKLPLWSVVYKNRDGFFSFFFPWCFIIYDDEKQVIYGEQHIESRKAAQKDADDMIARLSDGRMKLDNHGGVYAS